MDGVNLSILQIILLTALAGISIIDQMTFTLGLGAVNGIIGVSILAGLVVGNPMLGLLVGGLFQSYALGIGMFGGTAIPNWAAAAIMVTGLAGSVSNIDATAAIIGVPVAALTVQLDVLGRFANVAFQHRGDKYAKEGNAKQVLISNTLGLLGWTISRMTPVFLGLLVGPALITMLYESMPIWLSTGLSAVSKILPAIGMSVLLRYLPTKEYWHYLVAGFVLVAWFNAPILAVSLIGLALAVNSFKTASNQTKLTETVEGGGFDE